jgi:hypothetical protein
MLITKLLMYVMLITNYNIKIIKKKINLLENALTSNKYNITQKEDFINRIELLKIDYYIAIIQSDLK